MYTVFTIPPDRRAAVLETGAWGRLRRAAWKLLKGLGAAFGLEATHPVGDPPPCGLCGAASRWGFGGLTIHARCVACGAEGPQAEFHPHFNFLWIRKGTQQGKLESIELDGLKSAWALLVGSSREKENVYHGFAPGGARAFALRRHRVRYVVRYFPGLMAWAGNLRWYGRPPKLEAPPAGEAPENKCEVCGRKMTFAGPCTKAEAAYYARDLHRRFMRKHNCAALDEMPAEISPAAKPEGGEFDVF